MVDIIGKVVGSGWFKGASDDDMLKASVYPHGQLVKLSITGVKKERSYKELSCYHGSCNYIANMAFSEYMDHKRKVDFMTKLRCGFYDFLVFDPKTKQEHFIPKSLSYANCDQPESHQFIADALDRHAALVGISNTDDYVRLLNEQK